MYKDHKSLQYALEIIRILDQNGDMGSRDVCRTMEDEEIIDVSATYLSKVFPKMVRAEIITSCGNVYHLNKPASEISIADILKVSDVVEGTPAFNNFCDKILNKLSLETAF